MLFSDKGGKPRFDVFLKVENFGSNWLTYITSAYPEAGQVEITREIETFGFISSRIFATPILRATIRFGVSCLENAITLDLSEKVCRNVVAPMEAFKKHADAVEVLDGYRLSFKSPEALPSGLIFGVRDPIVLQPVQGGYLVVTKWGPEASIEEVQNGLLN